MPEIYHFWSDISNLTQYKADLIFHCDADEFWLPKSGNLKNELTSSDADVFFVDVVNVLLEDKGSEESFPMDTKYAVIKPIESNNLEEDSKSANLYLFRYPSKVIFKTAKGFLEVDEGNHAIRGDSRNLITKLSEDIKVYHYPIRSREHFFRKVIQGGVGFSLNKQSDKTIGWHWRRWYESYQNGRLDDEYKKLAIIKEKADKLLSEGIIARFDFEKFING